MSKKFLTNARIFSLNSVNKKIDTVEIENGRITKVGSAKDILPTSKSNSNISDLQQTLLIPGFTDSHIHLLAYGQSLLYIDGSTFTKQECLERISERVKTTLPGKWILGHGWDHNIWPDGYGSKEDLDNISKEHPIYLTHKSLHSGWANSTALRFAGINSNTTNPSNGIFIRDDDGELTGIILEDAMRVLESAIPKLDIAEVISAVKTAQKALNSFGITAVHDFDPWSVFEGLSHLRNNNELSLRVTKGIPEPYLEQALQSGLHSGQGDNWLKIGWLKLFADGALGPQTAAMLSPYENSDSSGMLFLTQEEIIEFGEKVLRNNIAMAIHAIGDRASQEVLNGYEELDRSGFLKTPSLSSRIEHVQLFSKEDLGRFNKHNITASMQPIHAISDMDMAEEYWGDRCNLSYAWQSISNSNADLIFGSDAPVESPNPFFGIYASIERKKLIAHQNEQENKSWIKEQCVSLKEALTAYIYTPPIIGGFGRLLGKIETGYIADMIVLPKDFLQFTPNSICCTHPIATMVNGNWVCKNDNIDIELK